MHDYEFYIELTAKIGAELAPRPPATGLFSGIRNRLWEIDSVLYGYLMDAGSRMMITGWEMPDDPRLVESLTRLCSYLTEISTLYPNYKSACSWLFNEYSIEQKKLNRPLAERRVQIPHADDAAEDPTEVPAS